VIYNIIRRLQTLGTTLNVWNHVNSTELRNNTKHPLRSARNQSYSPSVSFLQVKMNYISINKHPTVSNSTLHTYTLKFAENNHNCLSRTVPFLHDHFQSFQTYAAERNRSWSKTLSKLTRIVANRIGRLVRSQIWQSALEKTNTSFSYEKWYLCSTIRKTLPKQSRIVVNRIGQRVRCRKWQSTCETTKIPFHNVKG